MKQKYTALLIVAALGRISLAQESPTPTASVTPEQTASASPVASRSVPLRFVPPPMEGTISLGIFDSNGKLVRVLHREAKIDNFTIDENALKTTWDGKNDAGEDLPAGKYRAQGYLVGKLKVEDLGKVTSPPDGISSHISVKLVMNPLTSDTRAVMEITVRFDTKGSFLETMDGLPLFTVDETPDPSRVGTAGITKRDEKTADVWEDSEQNEKHDLKHLRVSSIDKLMAFDCGFFELR